jgi:hypothetical protein
VVVVVVNCVMLVSGAVVVSLGEQAARPMQQAKATKQQQNDMYTLLFISTPHPG